MRSSLKNSLSHEKLLRILDYDIKTGIFRWKYDYERKPQWNSKYINKIAGGLDKTSDRNQIVVYGVRYWSARLAWFYMTGSWPIEIDHENTIKNDDRFCNLREATHHENNRNRRLTRNNTSGYKGVSFHKQERKWRAYIAVNRKQTSLGLYKTPEEAHTAYIKAAKEYFGEFANFG